MERALGIDLPPAYDRRFEPIVRPHFHQGRGRAEQLGHRRRGEELVGILLVDGAARPSIHDEYAPVSLLVPRRPEDGLDLALQGLGPRLQVRRAIARAGPGRGVQIANATKIRMSVGVLPRNRAWLLFPYGRRCRSNMERPPCCGLEPSEAAMGEP